MTAKTASPKTRVNARAAAARAVAQTEGHDDKALAADTDSHSFENVFNKYIESQAEMLKLVGVPSWSRVAMALITALLVGMGVGWIVGTIIVWLVVGAVAVTGSMLLGWVIWLLGLVAAVWYGGKFGTRCGMAVLSREADAKASDAWNGVKSFFARKPAATQKMVAA